MITLPNLRVGVLSRLMFALAVTVPLVVVAVASVPALLILPFFPRAADRADRLIRRLMSWTVAVLLGADEGGRP